MSDTPRTDAFTKRFAKRLRDTRVNFAGLTQEELARKCGLTAFHISHFECGRRLPSLKNYAALVKALNTNAEQMIGLNNER